MTSPCLAPATTAGLLLDPALLDLIPRGAGGAQAAPVDAGSPTCQLL